MIIISGGWKALSFSLGKYLFVSVVLLRDRIVVSVLIGLDGPVLGKIGAVNDYLVPIFPFVSSG